jgi:hypothetical protein
VGAVAAVAARTRKELPMNWRKSSFSQGNTNSDCVEIARTPELTAVRDSKNPDGGLLTLPESVWQALRASL